MHITLETDYAIRIVDILARCKYGQDTESNGSVSGRMDAKTISEKADIPLRFALKILRKLVSSENIRSYKGIYGGYELAKTPSEISLYDVVEIVEGGYLFSRCLDSDYNCNCKNNNNENPGKSDILPCTYRQAFGEITELVCAELRKKTFDKLI